MKYITLLIFLFGHLLCPAQSKLEGIAYLYNEKGKNTALPDVAVKATGSGSAVTKANGYYAFNFDNSIAVTTLTVTRIGYEIINQEDLQTIDLKKKKQQNVYFDLEGNTEIRKRALFDAALKQSRKRRDGFYRILDAGGTEAEKLRIRLEKEAGRKISDFDEARSYLYKKFGVEADMIDKVVSSLIRMNLNHTNKEVDKIKKYTLNGDLDSALVLLDFNTAFKEIQRNNTLIKTASVANQAKKEKFLAGVPLLLSHGLYSKVDSVFTLAMLVDSSDLEIIFKYARFLQEQRQFTKPAELYRRFLSSPNLKNEGERASALNNLAILSDNIDQKKEAKLYYQEALTIHRGLTAKQPDVYETDLAICLNNIGTLLYSMTEYAAAKQYLEEAMEIRRRLVAKQQNISKADLASTLSNLGALADADNQKADAKKYLTEALEIIRSLTQQEPARYEAHLATTLNSLGSFSHAINESKKALQYYTEALEIRQRLVKKNPEAHEPDLANVLNNLGLLFNDINEMEASKKYYQDAIVIYKRLATLHPAAYSAHLSTILNNLAILYKDINQNEEARQYHLEALALRKRMAAKNPEAYDADVASTLNNLGVLSANMRKDKEAEAYYLQSLEIYRRLASKNPNAFEADIASAYNNLGALSTNLNKKDDALNYYSGALEIYHRLVVKNAETFKPKMANTLNNMGILYKTLGRKEEAEKYYLQALDLYQQLSIRNADVHQAGAAMTLNNLSLLAVAFNDKKEAMKYARQALEIYRNLTKKAPATYRSELAKSAFQLAKIYTESGGYDQAFPFYQEAFFHAKIHYALDNTYFNSLEAILADMVQTYKIAARQDSLIHYSKTYFNLIQKVVPAKRNANWSIKAKSLTASIASIYNNQCVADSAVHYYKLALTYCDTTLRILTPVLEKSAADPRVSKISSSYNSNASWYALHSKQIPEAEQYARRAIGIDTDPTNPAKTNLAHALLFQNRYKEAEEIYLYLKEHPYPADPSKRYATILLDDFKQLACSDAILPEHQAEVARIKKMLQE